MTGSGIIDLVIGLTFFLAVTTVLSSVVTELIARFLGLRGVYLMRGLYQLVDGGEGVTNLGEAQRDYGALKATMQQPAALSAVAGSTRPSAVAEFTRPSAVAESARPSATDALLGGPILRSQGMTGQISSRTLTMRPARRPGRPAMLTAVGGRRRWAQCRSLPSYISATSFAEAVIDLVVPDSAGETTMSTVGRSVNLLPDSMSTLRGALQAFVKNADDDITAFRTSVEHWYNDHMDRVSGWYKRHVARITLLVGTILVLLLNINVFTIGRTLYTESAVSTAVSSVAAKAVSCPPGQGQEACLADLQAELSGTAEAALPIGWQTVRDCVSPGTSCNWLDQRGILSRHGGSGWQLVLVFVGFLITIAGLVPGAQFWFGLLGKLGVLRASGPKPAADVPVRIDGPADARVQERIAVRVRETLLGDPLEAFDGLLVVQLLDMHGEPLATERPPGIEAGQPYRVVAYLAHIEPRSALAVEPVSIDGPQRPAAVSFTVSALSDLAPVSPTQVQIRAPANADSEQAEFSFVAPQTSGPLTLWVQLHQRDALVQVVRVVLNPEPSRVS